MLHDSKSYKGARVELFPFIPKDPNNVLDVGCNIGSTGRKIKDHFGDMTIVDGLDYNEDSIEEAKEFLDSAQVINLNEVSEFEEYLAGKKYDCIIFADVLEHILFPSSIVRIASQHLSAKGSILISLPNSGFYLSIFHLLRHKWPHNERGIYDKTHIKIFVANNLDILTPHGFDLTIKLRKYRFFESRGSKYDKLTKLIDFLPFFRNYFTFQFILELKKSSK